MLIRSLSLFFSLFLLYIYGTPNLKINILYTVYIIYIEKKESILKKKIIKKCLNNYIYIVIIMIYIHKIK